MTVMNQWTHPAQLRLGHVKVDHARQAVGCFSANKQSLKYF